MEENRALSYKLILRYLIILAFVYFYGYSSVSSMILNVFVF